MDVMAYLGLSGRRAIIVHHDDLGITDAQNRAFRALPYRSGSVMVPAGWAMDGLASGTSDLGVHLTLTSEWPAPRLRPLTPGPSLVDRWGYFWPSVAQAWEHADADEAYAEMRAQAMTAFQLGLEPTHMDSHMGTVLRPDLAAAAAKVGEEFGIPLLVPENLEDLPVPDPIRAALATVRAGLKMPRVVLVDTYDTMPEEDRRSAYIDRLSRLGPGIYHVLHHAAVPTEEGRRIPDWAKRRADFEALGDAEVRRVIAEFTPLTYAAIRDAWRALR